MAYLGSVHLCREACKGVLRFSLCSRWSGELHESSASCNSDEDALPLSQLFTPVHRIGARNCQDAIDQAHVDAVTRQLWNEVGTPSLHWVRLKRRMRCHWAAVHLSLLCYATGEHWRILWLKGIESRN